MLYVETIHVLAYIAVTIFKMNPDAGLVYQGTGIIYVPSVLVGIRIKANFGYMNRVINPVTC
jgi:hypothetical protein